LLCKRGWFVCL
nr:immunoglobulin heavy chain junction region [Mus musculus]